MADLRIVDAPVLLQESITDDVKMPTGGLGNYAIRLGDLVWYVVTKEQLANKSYVDNSSKGVQDKLDAHIANKNNPHEVTKQQVGLGNVDNTADIDKPVSNATKSAITTATNDMATKAYVNQKDNLKADKATTLSGYGITDAYAKGETYSRTEIDDAMSPKADKSYVDNKDGDLTTLATTDKTNLVKAINELHSNTEGVVELYNKNVGAGVGANGWTDTLIALDNGRTQKEKNADFISVKDFGAKGDGIADDTTAFEKAAASGKALKITDGTYIVNRSIVFNNKMHVDFSPNAKVIANGTTYAQNAVFVCSGSVAQIADLSADAVKGASSITLASTTGLQAGDLLCIFNPTNGSWSGFRDNYKAGEFIRVKSVSGNKINLTKPLFDSYVIADVDVYKVTPVSINLNNPQIESNGNAFGLIKVTYASGVAINNPMLTNRNNNCLSINKSVGVTIIAGDTKNYGTTGDDYGLAIGNSQNVRVFGGTWYARRHAIASGGDAEICCVPCRDIKYIGCDISNDIDSGTHSADMHGNAEFVEYYKCTIKNGVTMQGANVSLSDNHIYGGMDVGSCIYTAEVLGGEYNIKDNKLYCFVNPQLKTRGVIDFGGNTIAISDKTNRDLIINMTDNTLNSDVLSNSTTVLVATNRGTDKKININCQNNTLNVNALNAMIFIKKVSGTAATDYLICDNNTCNQTGMFSFYPDVDYTVLPKLRCQATSWAETVTTDTTKNAITGTAKIFTWRFPRTPYFFTNNGDSGYVSTIVPITKAISVSGQKATLWLSTGDSAKNFPAATSVNLYGRAEICEV